MRQETTKFALDGRLAPDSVLPESEVGEEQPASKVEEEEASLMGRENFAQLAIGWPHHFPGRTVWESEFDLDELIYFDCGKVLEYQWGFLPIELEVLVLVDEEVVSVWIEVIQRDILKEVSYCSGLSSLGKELLS